MLEKAELQGGEAACALGRRGRIVHQLVERSQERAFKRGLAEKPLPPLPQRAPGCESWKQRPEVQGWAWSPPGTPAGDGRSLLGLVHVACRPEMAFPHGCSSPHFMKWMQLLKKDLA